MRRQMFLYKLGMISWGGLVGWSSMVGWGRFVCFIAWSAFVGNFHNVARISISGVVFYDLGTAIGEEDTVFSTCGVSISTFVLSIVKLCIVINDFPFKVIFGWFVIRWCLVRRLMIGRSWLVDWSWDIGWSRFVSGDWSVSISSSCMVCLVRIMLNSVAVPIMSMSVFHSCMAFNVGHGNGDESEKSDEGLHDVDCFRSGCCLNPH